MASIFEFIKSIFKAWFSVPIKVHKVSGPDTLEELIKQFDLPKKEKTSADMIRDYQIFLTMAALEYDMLKMEPSIKFYSHNWIEYEGGKAYYDWAPCTLRPEVLYCNYGKN